MDAIMLFNSSHMYKMCISIVFNFTFFWPSIECYMPNKYVSVGCTWNVHISLENSQVAVLKSIHVFAICKARNSNGNHVQFVTFNDSFFSLLSLQIDVATKVEREMRVTRCISIHAKVYAQSFASTWKRIHWEMAKRRANWKEHRNIQRQTHLLCSLFRFSLK